MLLADSHRTMVVGIDVHVTTTPPFNLLHPYIGMVLDVADYIPFLGTNVSVNGLKRGVSDTGGINIAYKEAGNNCNIRAISGKNSDTVLRNR